MVFYYVPEVSSPDEDKSDIMERWMSWAESAGEGLVDMGSPLGNGAGMTLEGAVPSTRAIAGYSVLQAESMEEAQKLLEGHPHLEQSGECCMEIYESMPMPK